MTLRLLSIGPELFSLAQPKDCNFELKSPTNLTLSERLLMVSKTLSLVRISIWAVNGSQSQVLLLERSMSITKASLSVFFIGVCVCVCVYVCVVFMCSQRIEIF